MDHGCPARGQKRPHGLQGDEHRTPTREHINSIMKARWHVEVYHRDIKQTCGIENCQSHRNQRNHIFLAVPAWIGQTDAIKTPPPSTNKNGTSPHAIAEYLRQLIEQGFNCHVRNSCFISGGSNETLKNRLHGHSVMS
jgi:hypothetical protein